MATHPIVVIPGDGIGPEVTVAVQRILAAAQAPIEWHTRLAGIAALEAQDEVLPDETIELIRRVGLAHQGALHDSRWRGIHIDQCPAAQAIEFVCRGPSGPQPGGSHHAIRRRGSRDHSGEH